MLSIVPTWFYNLIVTLIICWSNTRCRVAFIKKLHSSSRRSVASSKSSLRVSQATVGAATSSVKYGRCELDSHADTTVAGSNCIVLQFTGKECDVSPYREDYDSINNVPIAHVATAWQSPETGQTYILVFNEALWMGDTLPHTLINPNQLRHFGVEVQDNPCCNRAMFIRTEDGSFCMELQMEGTIVFVDTHTPTQKELETFPKVHMSSSFEWNPMKVTFPKSNVTLEEEVGGFRYLSGVSTLRQEEDLFDIDHYYLSNTCFNLESINRSISAMKRIVPEESPDVSHDLGTPLTQDESIDVGTTDVPILKSFQSSDRHTDVSPEDLSERWGISVATAIKTLAKTTQRFLRSAVLPLSRRYRVDRVFTRKTLKGQWSTDTMDGRCTSIEGNKYAQVFANKSYFARLYPMDRKSKAGDALRLFCQEFGVPDSLIFDGSKEQTCKGTEFMKQVRTHNINYHVSEPGMHNQNPVEGVIREIRRKWYRIMIRKRVLEEFWDYGCRWVTETSSLTWTSVGGMNGCIPVTDVTGETGDISEYLDFGFYDPVWYKDNAGLSPNKAGRWLGVASRTGRLMCYHVLTQTGEVISRSSVQRVTNLELSTSIVKDTFAKFDERIRLKIRPTKERGYIGDKPNPEDWNDLIEEDEDFADEFQKIFNDNTIKEADDEFTPEIFHDHYVNMEVALPRDDTGPEYARVTKRLRDANGIPIGTANDNPMLDTRLYEVEYPDGYKASLTANAIAENLFAQVDDEGNRFVLLDSIVDHRVDGSQVQGEDAFITSPHGGKKRVETTKGWEILVQWKDRSTSWESMKDIKAVYPVQLAEYAIQQKISKEPAFAWWIPHIIKN